MMKFLIAIAALIMPLTVSAVPIISFDDDAATQTGTLTYGGAGGSLVGVDISFESIVGQGTPLNDGVILECRDCAMSFTTGANTVEGVVNEWLAGGVLSVMGDVYDGVTLVASGILAAGAFTIDPVGVVAGSIGTFTGIGIDNKAPELAEFYGLSNPFDFASSQIALGSCSDLGGGGFTCGVTNADFDNAGRVDAPGAAWLMGIGAAGLVASRKKGKGRGK